MGRFVRNASAVRHRLAAISSSQGRMGLRQIEPEYRPQGAQKRLLGHVLGILPVVQHPVAQAEDDAVKPLNQQASRLGISRPDCLDQRGVVHRHGQLARPPQWPPTTRRLTAHTAAAGRPFQDSPPTPNYSVPRDRAGASRRPSKAVRRQRDLIAADGRLTEEARVVPSE